MGTCQARRSCNTLVLCSGHGAVRSVVLVKKRKLIRLCLVVGRYLENIGCWLAENVVIVVVVAVVSCDPDIPDWCKRHACLYVDEQISEIIILKWADLKRDASWCWKKNNNLTRPAIVFARNELYKLSECLETHWGCCIEVGSPGGDEKVAPRCIINRCSLRKWGVSP